MRDFKHISSLLDALEQVPSTVMITAKDGAIVYVNRAFELLSGYSRRECLGKSPSLLRSGHHDDRFYRQLWKALSKDKPFSATFVNRNRNGALFYEDKTISPLRIGKGCRSHYIATGTDVTDQRRAKIRYAKLATRYRLMAKHFPGLSYRADVRASGKTKFLSQHLPHSAESELPISTTNGGFPFGQRMQIADRERRQASIAAAIKHNRPFELEYEIRNGKGDSRYCLEYGTPIRSPNGKLSSVEGVILDISDQRRLQKNLAKSRSTLRSVSSQMLVVHESESKRIARELHDGIGQILTSINMRLESLGEGLNKNDIESSRRALDATVPMVRGALEEIRRMSMNLRPPILDDLGLDATVTWFCRNFSETFGVRVDCDLSVEKVIVAEGLKIAIYRVLQEAMNNIAKHAQATSVHVHLREMHGALELTIDDNGLGFDVSTKTSNEETSHGLGLVSMRERVWLSGGTFSIESSNRIGTIVRARWPKTRTNGNACRTTRIPSKLSCHYS